MIFLFGFVIVNAQDRSAYVTKFEYANTTMEIAVGSDIGNLYSYPTKNIYTFSNEQPVNLKLSVWIPGSDYAFKLFGLAKEHVSIETLNTHFVHPEEFLLYTNKPYVKLLRKFGHKLGINAVPDIIKNNLSIPLRSTTSFIEITSPPKFIPPVLIHNGRSDNVLNERIGWLEEDEALPVWTSDIRSFEAGEGHVTDFIWDGYSNRDEIRRLIEDSSAIYVLEDADTDDKLDISYLATYAFYEYANRTIGTDIISENWVATADMPIIAHFILKDPFCNFAPYDALRGGVQGIMDFLNFECSIGNGVIAYATTGHEAVEGVAAATQKTFEGTIVANQVSSMVWQPVPGSNHTELTKLSPGKYYVMTILWHSLNPEEYTVGKGTPLLGAYLDEMVLTEDFPLKTNNSIETLPTSEFTVVWEGDTPYFIVNNQKIKAEVHNLSGQKVQTVESAQLYIVSAHTEDGRSYTQVVVR